jgi:hypothetical protein
LLCDIMLTLTCEIIAEKKLWGVQHSSHSVSPQ